MAASLVSRKTFFKMLLLLLMMMMMMTIVDIFAPLSSVDVLSFPMDGDEGLLGDIVVSLPVAKRQARQVSMLDCLPCLHHKLIRLID
jgi:hypothetical protein